ncbi:MAG: DUF1223 domain-containing protein [Acidobacteriota bacterium]
MRLDGRVLGVVLGAVFASLVGASPEAAEGDVAAGPVLVELFTSQGCSSCPPADRLLRQLAADPDLAARLVPLAFHVDYWNDLGWRDPFSKRRWTERQVAYDGSLGVGTLYTPQLVVAGREHVVGSHEGEVRRALEEALARPAVGRLEARLESGTGHARVTLERPLEAAAELWLAEIESGFATDVPRGENADRQLRNDYVVRHLERLAVLSAGQTELAATFAMKADAEGQAVVFLQQRGHGPVWLTAGPLRP